MLDGRSLAGGLGWLAMTLELGDDTTAQRLLAELSGVIDRPVFVHGMMLGMIDAYREAGVSLPDVRPVIARAGGRGNANGASPRKLLSLSNALSQTSCAMSSTSLSRRA